MKRAGRLWIGIALTLGCAPASEPATFRQATEQNSTEQNSVESAALASDVQLDVLDWEATRALVNQHPGKVVIMDLWATYCPPCMEEFPNLVNLHRQHGDRLACISVSADYDGTEDRPVEAVREKVMKFLVKQNATFQNVLLSTDAETLFTKKLKQQSLPIVLVFDQQGKLQGEFPDPENPDEFNYQEDVIPLVEKLLATAP